MLPSLFSLFPLLFSSTNENQIPVNISEDTYIESVFFDENRGYTELLLIGYNFSGREGFTDTYLKYNLNDINLEMYGELIEAQLHLYLNSNKDPEGGNIYITEANTNWDEQTLIAMNAPGIKLNSEPLKFDLPSQPGPISFDISAIVKKQLQQGYENNGIIITKFEPHKPAASFYSKDCISCDIKQKPYLRLLFNKKSPDIFKLSTNTNSKGETTITWDYIENEEYLVSIYKDINLNELVHQSDEINTSNYKYTFTQSGGYFIKAETVSQNYTSKTIYLDINIENIETEEKIISLPTKSEPQKIEVLIKEEREKIEENAITEEKINETPKDISQSVLGTSSFSNIKNSYCIYTYNLRKKKIHKEECVINPPKIIKIQQQKIEQTHWLDIEYSKDQYIDVILLKKDCMQPTLKNPLSYFQCIMVTKSKKIKRVKGDKNVWGILNDNQIVQGYNKSLNNGHSILSLPLNSDLQGTSIKLGYSFSYSEKIDNTWLDIWEWSKKSNSKTIPKPENKKSTGIYSFPFKQIIGVTQWYGNTYYQNPHTGIDFGAYTETIYAITDGTVIAAKWDQGSSKCLSGGYYLKLKHTDGKYSLYLHLKEFLVKTGDKVNRGDPIAISGKSGFFNCERLSSHLHFEIRKGESQSTHTNPVPYINVDWKVVRTIGTDRYPQRLTGDNPHPGY